MPDYQLYRVDYEGYIVGFAGEVTCDTDEHAIERARQCVDGVAMEVWDHARFVKRLDSKIKPPTKAAMCLDTTTPAGKAMFQMMGVFAEFERAITQERIRAGLRRARDEGKRHGRPKIAPDLEAAIQAALARKDRPGVRVIAAAHDVSVNTVQRIAHGG